MTHARLMLQGTGSNVGKSLLVAGLCRAYADRGLRVRPFKPQNMSNNAAIAGDGFEIGRAQALQARAARTAATPDMNPVLLKPQTDVGAQIILQGKANGSADARAFHNLKRTLMPVVRESYERLAGDADLVLVEGAGSPAEVNLREGDIANMGFATAADVPVVLVGDIERGGVIASLVGTAALLPADERARIKGYIVNKFRGDPRLFDGAHPIITQRTGWAPLGVVPWLDEARHLPDEDAVALDGHKLASQSLDGHAARAIKIAVPCLSRISNFDDLDPLRAEPDVALTIVELGAALPGDADLILIPGSKATRVDLELLRAEGWDIDLKAHRRRGGWVLGICGGYQMLGRSVTDPAGIEGAAGKTEGLGLLDIDTELMPEKALHAAQGREIESGEGVSGYEMHIGVTTGADCARPMLALGGVDDGACSADGRVQGTYLHGLFGADGFRHAYLNRLRQRDRAGPAFEATVEAALDALAAHLEQALDLDRLMEIARG